MPQYRGYFFVHNYLSSVQCGVQTAHTVSEMFIKYQVRSCTQAQMLDMWARNSKTLIMLKGGNSLQLWEHQELFSEGDLYPHAHFLEDESLNCAITCVGIIVPERIWTVAQELRQSPRSVVRLASELSLSQWELEVIELISSSKLAS